MNTLKVKLGFDVKNIKKLDLRYAEFLTRSYIATSLEKTLFHRTSLENVSLIDSRWPERYIIYEEKKMKDKDIDLTFKELETIYRDLKQNLQLSPQPTFLKYNPNHKQHNKKKTREEILIEVFLEQSATVA